MPEEPVVTAPLEIVSGNPTKPTESELEPLIQNGLVEDGQPKAYGPRVSFLGAKLLRGEKVG